MPGRGAGNARLLAPEAVQRLERLSARWQAAAQVQPERRLPVRKILCCQRKPGFISSWPNLCQSVRVNDN
jgi:hypothetical protein